MMLLRSCAVLLLCGLPAAPQKLLDGVGSTIHLAGGDLALLEAHEELKELSCNVKPIDPVLGFDLRFHAGFDVSVPLKELAGEGNTLTMLFRVTPESNSEGQFYFQQDVHVPQLPENASGDSALGGVFDVGEGKYKVDWMMRDQSDRVCTRFWEAKAELSSSEREMSMEIPANTAAAYLLDPYYEDPPVERAGGPQLNVKLMVNFAPQDQDSSALRPLDTIALLTMLRHVSRDPRVGRLSLVAFNIQDQRVIYTQWNADRIDFPALGEAVSGVVPGLVDAQLLAKKKGEVAFLTDLIREEMARSPSPDAMVFMGPKYSVEGSPDDALKAVGTVGFPVFYLNYNVSPQDFPWRDAIGRAIRVFGGKEYSINRPRDTWTSVTEMVGRIVELKQGSVPAPR